MKKNNSDFRYMNTDYSGKKTENHVAVERVPVVKDEVMRVDHDIFFEKDFIAFTNPSDKAGSLLRRGIDYEFCDPDSIATEMSNQNCYKRFIVHTDDEFVYVSYRVYGDFVSAEFLNEVKSLTVDVDDSLRNFKTLVDSIQQIINEHINASGFVHGASDVTPTPNSLALRSATGTLIANEATKSDELVTLSQLETVQSTLQNGIDANAQLDNELYQKLIAECQAVESEAFAHIVSTNGVDPNDEAAWNKALDDARNERVNQTLAYHNTIRNENGSLAVPNATKPNEAVNKQQLESYIDSRFNTLVGAAPESLDTLAEIAQALNHDANMYSSLEAAIATRATQALKDAKSYTDEKLATFPTYTPPVYSTTSTMASPTGEILFTDDGTRHEIKRLSVELHGVQNNFVVDTSAVGTITKVVRIDGVLTETATDMQMSAGANLKCRYKKSTKELQFVFNEQNAEFNVLVFIDFI